MYYTSLTKAIAAKGHIDLSKCPNIHCSGSVRGKDADVVRHGNYIYCIGT